MGLKCLHTSIFIETPSLEWLPSKAKENPSPHEMRLSSAGHQPNISWSIIIIIIIIIINIYSGSIYKYKFSLVLPWLFYFAVNFSFCCGCFVLPSFLLFLPFCFAVAFWFYRGFLLLPWHLWATVLLNYFVVYFDLTEIYGGP